MAKKREGFLERIAKSKFGSVLIEDSWDSNILRNSPYYREIENVYKLLGGIQNEAPLKPGKFDIFTREALIELDEENHFNRYRLITLESDVYNNIQGVDLIQYKKYCRTRESKCRKDGGYWTNPSAEKQFGVSDSNGEFTTNGSSRWKQRAFYDFLKDVYSLETGRRLIRIPIYETYNYHSIDDILSHEDRMNLVNYLNKRINP